MSSGTATSAKSQKLGLRNAVTVNANQTLRRRKKSRSLLNRMAIGLASQNMGAAVAKTTIIAFTLLGIVAPHGLSCTADLMSGVHVPRAPVRDRGRQCPSTLWPETLDSTKIAVIMP